MVFKNKFSSPSKKIFEIKEDIFDADYYAFLSNFGYSFHPEQNKTAIQKENSHGVSFTYFPIQDSFFNGAPVKQ